MGLLNNDYNELKRQIDYVNSRFVFCKTKEEFANCFSTYETLCELYEMSTGINLFDLSGPIKLTAAVGSDSFKREKLKEFYDKIYEQRRYSYRLFKEVYDKGVPLYFDFLREEYDKLNSLQVSQLSCEMEAMQIFYSFLDSEFPEAKVVFDELLSDGRMFEVGAHSKYSDRRGYSFFNSVENKGNMFLRENFGTISDLSAFAHEFGHIIDASFLSRSSVKDVMPITNSLRLDVEVLACNYQFKFLEYLIKNGLYKDDAKRELASNLNSLFYHLENGILTSLASHDEFEGLKYGRLTKEQYISRLIEREDLSLLPEFLDLDDTSYLLTIPETLRYSYGVALGSCLSDKSSYVRYMAGCNEGDLISRLKGAEITKQKAAHQLVKKIDCLYN